MAKTFTREGDRCFIDGVEVSKAEWEALYAQMLEDEAAADEADEGSDWPDADPSKEQH